MARQPETGAGGDDSAGNADMQKLTLLIVDDEPIITKMLERLLRNEFEVLVAFNGLQGLDLFLEKKPEIVLTDQRMPGMTGLEMVKAAKKEAPSSIFILLTGHTDMDAMVEALNLHLLHRYVTKPWDQEELLAILREGRELFCSSRAP